MLVVATGAATTARAQQAADRIYVNGRVWTGDDARPRAEALAVRGDGLLAVGANGEIQRLRGPATEVVDLRGRFVVPGFNDSHIHLLKLEAADLAGAEDLGEVQRRIREFASAHRDRPWVTGRGWAYSAFPGGLPHRKLLDEIVPDRPAWMTGYDGHTGWANSKALVLAGITRDMPDPANGVIVRDLAGEATGAFKEGAMGLVRRLIPPPSEEEKRLALLKRLDEAAAYGLTSVQNAGEIDLPVFEAVRAAGLLKLRVYAALPFRQNLPPEEWARYKALREQHRGPALKFGAVKGLVDGVVESGTAAMFEPYAATGGTGLPTFTQQELDAAVAAFDREGFQILLHAIGERAIAMALDAYERAARANGTSARRHRIEHVEVPRASDLPRFARLGVIAATQAIFANPDRNTLEVYAPNLGPARAARAMPFRSIDAAGARQAFGSDYPVFSMEVLPAIYCAATRTTPAGTPAGGWQPQERISAEAALRHFTVDAAFASFDEDVKGSLEAGKLADFVVLSDDILAGPPERILKARVLLTVMGGRDTYRAREF